MYVCIHDEKRKDKELSSWHTIGLEAPTGVLPTRKLKETIFYTKKVGE